MSACDTCSSPGHCCKDFVVFSDGGMATFPEDAWKTGGTKWARDHGLPFIPLRIEHDQKWTTPPKDGHVAVRWMCPNLDESGRCGDYMNRPQLCRSFEPLSDRLCVMYVAPVTDDQLK